MNKSTQFVCDKLQHEKEVILRWMDANDAHMSLHMNEELRVINEQLTKIQ